MIPANIITGVQSKKMVFNRISLLPVKGIWLAYPFQSILLADVLCPDCAVISPRVIRILTHCEWSKSVFKQLSAQSQHKYKKGIDLLSNRLSQTIADSAADTRYLS